MRIIIGTAGSTGDVYPFLAAARLLQRRTKHEVVVIANDYFRGRAEAAHLEFHAHSTIEDYERSFAPPPGSLANPFTLVRGVNNMMYLNFFKPIRRTFEIIAEVKTTSTLLFAHGICFGARLARDAFHLPLISAILSPVGVPGARYPGFSPFTQLVGNRLCKRNINRYCAAQGLVPIRKVDGWSLSPDGIAALFPAFYDAGFGSWPASVTAVGYHAFDTCEPDGTTAQAMAFAGDEPALLFTSGTPIRNAHPVFRAAVDTCRRLEKKGILVTKYRDQVPIDLPPSVMHVPYASFRHVFPRCAAVVHHGGIGTSMEALLAGVPQLVAPQVADQHYNAARLKELGVADVLDFRRFDAAIAADKIAALVGSKTVASRCASLRERMQREDPEESLLRLIDSIAGKAAGSS